MVRMTFNPYLFYGRIPSIKWIKNSLIVVEACMDKTWEVLNSGHWQFVPIEYRYCYTLCTILKVI